MTPAALLAIMLALVPLARHEHRGESSDAARDRYETIATAIAGVAKSWHEAAYVLTAFTHESGFRRDVHRGVERGDNAESWCLGQVHLDSQHSWTKVPGTDYRARDLVGVELAPTTRCAEVVTIKLRRGIAACGADNARCVFRHYGGVTSKNHPGIAARVATFEKLRRKR